MFLFFAIVLVKLQVSSLPDIKILGEHSQELRNIAYLRAAYHSSSINEFNTGHLATNGLCGTSSLPLSSKIASQYSDQPNIHKVHHLFNSSQQSTFLSIHPQTWIKVEISGPPKLPSTYVISPSPGSPSRNPRSWKLLGSFDGNKWTVLDTKVDFTFSEGYNHLYAFNLTQPAKYNYYCLNITQNNGNLEGFFGGMIQFSLFDIFDKSGKSIFGKKRAANENAEKSKNVLFENYWEPLNNHSEWLIVDFGELSEIHEVTLTFSEGYIPQSYSIEVSNCTDGERKNNKAVFKTVYEEAAASSKSTIQHITFNDTVYGTMIKLFIKSGKTRLKQIEVMGINGLTVKPSPQPQFDNERMRQDLSGGNWKLQRASEVVETGESISLGDYDDDNWVIATVPGTVLVSYLNLGAIPDPNFGDQQLQISDSFFTTDFWYRDSFDVSEKLKGKRCWLNFDGINWKADVWVNGVRLGKRIEGAFIRGRYDITHLIKYKPDTETAKQDGIPQGCLNHIAVFIHKCEHPGEVDTKTADYAGHNGGILGKDNPTIHASIGWDWVMTIRGRNTGIYNDVYLTFTGDVVIRDPWVETHLQDVDNPEKALLTFRCDVQNALGAYSNDEEQSNKEQNYGALTAEIRATLEGTDVLFVTTVKLESLETKTIEVNATLSNPRLWWPNRYGEQYLYKCNVKARIVSSSRNEREGELIANENKNTSETERSNSPSDEISDFCWFDVGVRELEFSKSGVFRIRVNGKPIFCSGGNWGMDESMLRCRTAEDYETRVRLHKEAHFTMIRNWVGMTGDEEFYAACDRNGILIHDDFWLANPWDGPEPSDEKMFIENAKDKVKFVRKHPSLCFYCGRNEGQPPRGLYDPLKRATIDLDGSRFFVGSSADPSEGVELQGNGPYTVQGPYYYYNYGQSVFHSEMGMPNVPSAESIREMIPSYGLWPRGLMWGLHDFASGSAQNGTRFVRETTLYGEDRKFKQGNALVPASEFEEFVWRSQFVNYENHKAMFEGYASKGASALLMWMSQSCWPSMVWQTYDFFFDTNAGYFGCKKANQPLNLMYNFHSKMIYLVNNAGKMWKDVKVYAWVHLPNGKQYSNTSAVVDVSSSFVTTNPGISPKFPSDRNFFLTTKVTQNDGNGGETVISDNFYWEGGSSNSRSLRYFTSIENGTVEVSTSTVKKEPSRSLLSFWSATPVRNSSSSVIRFNITLRNTSPNPLLLVHLRIHRFSESNSLLERVLPVYFEDNWFGLMPSFSKTVSVEFDEKLLLGDRFAIVVEGYNLKPMVLQMPEKQE
ncbi:putative glycosyl hydrolase family 2 [Monocercomonoides exilis]|uniref:putative glycosyl hydrolase family 2 n=1 Tax=Monocercomonoides exilis TaxID=2049356 RepID=UPI00355A76F9|nr:putative glycosyl hydrolase family 2 [Monocercomonoides exilis]|eukprot:MONOS_1688.1-p1 / transcript=MONOS_1688.1 / gene=MONOS_1688 / organism=Monocercomonoides_exilis_PA203 / gene_product=putative uncharacterized protein / transcript_product=putative uncharacterized protein / location=Mono_scaffold00031:95679-99536(-) / protein_length=1285 / sequence_SO=supercontig / SO=protein_coding / is_pseudo=false